MCSRRVDAFLYLAIALLMPFPAACTKMFCSQSNCRFGVVLIISEIEPLISVQAIYTI